MMIVAATLVLPGSDVYTHTHEAWLFHYMMQHKVLLSEDFSMLSGHQPLYGVGTFSYILAGLGWFVFGASVIKALEVILFAGIILLSLRIFANTKMLFVWYALIFIKILLPDSLPYLFSMFLFYLGVYFVKRFKNKPFGDIAISVAGLNHPYVAVSNLITIFFGRATLFLSTLIVLLVQVFLLKYVFFSGLVKFELDNVLDLVIRSAVMLFPFAASSMPKFLARFANLKTAYCLAIAGIFVIYPIFLVPFELGWKDGLSCYYAKTYSEIPNLPGNIRIVDPCRNWIYLFPVRGMVTSLSPYFEGQYYQHQWGEQEYISYLSATNTSYVIFCKDCEIKTKTLQETGELGILNQNFPVYADLKGYTVFYVGNATGLPT
jgi:hypothetical protein